MITNRLINRNPLYFAFFLPAVIDGILTIVGQPVGYLINPSIGRDASPAHYVIVSSPWLFAAGAMIWYLFWYKFFKMRKMPEIIKYWLMFLFVAGHSWGSSQWIWKILKDHGWVDIENQVSVELGWGIMVLYLMIVALTGAVSLKMYISQVRVKRERGG